MQRRKRPRGSIEELASGSLRVSVYAGIDPVTKRRHYLREVVPAGPKSEAEATRVLRRLANQVDDQHAQETLRTAFFVGGGALVAGGAVLFLLSGPKTEGKGATTATTRLAPIASAHELGLGLRGAF